MSEIMFEIKIDDLIYNDYNGGLVSIWNYNFDT